MIITYILYMLIGATSGTIMGLLGGGAALIIIPAIVMILSSQNIAPQASMQIAIGTFFAIAIIMLSSSTYTHHKYKAIDWHSLKKMAFGIIIGTMIGGLISHHLPTHVLKIIFAVFSIIIAIWLLFKNDIDTKEIPTTGKLFSGGTTLGLISGTIGIGSFTVPFLRKCGLDIRQSVATSTVCSFIIAWIGTATYIFTGYHQQGLPMDSTGYIYWPIFFPIAITSIIFAPMGAKLAHRISKNSLKFIYSALLIIIGLKMLM